MKKLLIAGLFLFMAGNILGAELGAGGGSGYPSVIDTDASVESSATIARADVPNDLADAIIKIETELGIDPSGGYATVADRIDDFTLYVDTITDQTIDGQKTFTETLTVSSHVRISGTVLISSQPCARAYLSSAQSILNATITQVALNTDSGTGGFDVGSNFNITTSSFTCPVAGKYTVSVKSRLTSATDGKLFGVFIYKNDSLYSQAYFQSGITAALHGVLSDTLDCSENDTISFHVYHDIGSPTDITAGATQTFMTIRLVQ